jgi:hypothetical protein
LQLFVDLGTTSLRVA